MTLTYNICVRTIDISFRGQISITSYLERLFIISLIVALICISVYFAAQPKAAAKPVRIERDEDIDRRR